MHRKTTGKVLVISGLILAACGDLPPKDANSKTPGQVGLNGTDSRMQLAPGQGLASRNGHFTVAAQWVSVPRTHVAGSCNLTFADGSRHTLSSFSIQSVIPWNYAQGQGGSLEIALSPSLQNPAYITASNIVFNAPGEWTMQVTATANGVSDIADIPVTVYQ